MQVRCFVGIRIREEKHALKWMYEPTKPEVCSVISLRRMAFEGVYGEVAEMVGAGGNACDNVCEVFRVGTRPYGFRGARQSYDPRNSCRVYGRT